MVAYAHMPGARETTMYDLEEAINDRRSIRSVLPDQPVPREWSTRPSNWPSVPRRTPTSSPGTCGWRRAPPSRLVAALLQGQQQAATGPRAARAARASGELVTHWAGCMGIARLDVEGRRIAVLRNWEFFRAPLAGIVCMHRDLHHVDTLGVGMFLQTFLLALTARGLGTCVQVSIAGYPEIVREQLNISQEYAILCGMAIGYPDPTFPANNLRTDRNPIERNVVFHDA